MTTIYTPEDVYNFANNGNIDEFIIALNQGDNSSNWYRDSSGNTALHKASNNGYIEIVKLIVNNIILDSKTYFINSKTNDGCTPLILTVDKNYIEIVKILIQTAGVDVNRKDNNGWTALHRACSKGFIDIVSILLSNGAYLNCKTNNRLTALHEASRNNHIEVVKLLLDNGIDLNLRNSNGRTALHEACRNNHIEVFKELINRGADIHITDNYNENPLNYSISNHHFEIIKIILDKGINFSNKDLSLIFLMAINDGDIDLIKTLIHKGTIDINYKDEYSGTYLHFAISNNNFEIVKLLIENGADINAMDCYGITPLMESSRLGRIEFVSILIDHYVNIDEDIDIYAPDEGDIDGNGNLLELIDCRPIIFVEAVNRQERADFDLFINHYIEYQPYVKNIYSLCYPSGNLRCATPSLGWIKGKEIRDKYYFDEVFFYLHMHVANVYANNRPGTIEKSSLISKSSEYFSINDNKVSTLMVVLSDRLKMMLQPSDIPLNIHLIDSDIELVMSQVNCNRAQAIYALRINDFDIVNAIMILLKYEALMQ